jgi:hypothetical protein
VLNEEGHDRNGEEQVNQTPEHKPHDVTRHPDQEQNERDGFQQSGSLLPTK